MSGADMANQKEHQQAVEDKLDRIKTHQRAVEDKLDRIIELLEALLSAERTNVVVRTGPDSDVPPLVVANIGRAFRGST